MKISQIAENKNFIEHLEYVDKCNDAFNDEFRNCAQPGIEGKVLYNVVGTNCDFSPVELLTLISRYEKTGIDFDLNDIKINNWSHAADRVPETGTLKMNYFRTPRPEHAATLEWNPIGYIKDGWFWRNFSENTEENLNAAKPGLVVRFNWKGVHKTQAELQKYLEEREKTGMIHCESPDIFDSAKEYAIYKLFSELVYSGNRMLRTQEFGPMLFFPVEPNSKETKKLDNVCRLLIGIEKFADLIVEKINGLKMLLQDSQAEKLYGKKLRAVKNELESFYNAEVVPFALVKRYFSEINLFEFIAPKPSDFGWVPDDLNDRIEAAVVRDKYFGEFSKDKLLKKIYFDLYDLCFDKIVDFAFTVSGCGKGWKPLIRTAFETFKSQEAKSYFWWQRVYVAQIKEKFGGLRIYVDTPASWYFDHYIKYGDDPIYAKFGETVEVDRVISDLEGKSFKTCENCGKTQEEDSSVAPAGPGWIKTYCHACRKEKDSLHKNI